MNNVSINAFVYENKQAHSTSLSNENFENHTELSMIKNQGNMPFNMLFNQVINMLEEDSNLQFSKYEINC